ncbi:GRIP and coiled-coil domain-containing protein 1 [Heteronotia binoei]|uniref:GRIP and coiled-coil domain-containing protein 1 n=1 Tax=Heteronotia binoei TaxID=13085 RepID=UPI0029307568|nr:GRIP and coiled-coil domain-containing protein 1 [Heteronotia binoei]
MEKLGMAFGGGGPSRRELQETVEAQQQQLAQYQARLKDVVRAYKSLLKEKEALEASLRVLGAGRAEEPGPREGEEEEAASASAPSPPRLDEASGSESGSTGEPSEADRRLLQLKTQLATVTSALATVTQEKSRMEASYQADKKKMKQELEEAGRRAAEELKAAQEQLAETRARLITQQHDRAQEQSDHAVMLHELQRLLQSERAQRQEAELSLEETREALAGKAGVAGQMEGYERQAKQLAQEVDGLRRALQAAQEESSRPDPQLQELQAEVVALKNSFQAQLLQEMRKTAQAEERVQMEERRVTNLEVQMSEVSELLGAYEKAKQKDQVAIHKLKERVAQLDLENKTLAMAASGRSPLDFSLEESSLDVNILKEKMEKLQQLLQAAAKHGQCPPALETFCLPELPAGGGTENGDGEKASAAYYQQELKQLKEEFERYKLRAQVVLKNKAAKDGSLAKELEEAQEQLAELKEKYVSLRLSCEAGEKQHRAELEAKKQDLSRLQQLHRQELERAQAACQERLLLLEEEMHKQRDRALAMLAEKDQELEQLRTVVLPSGLQGARKALAGPGPQASSSSSQEPQPEGTESLESLTQALRLTAPGEPGFLLYTEQLARQEVAVAALKKEKRRLEAEAHRLQARLLQEGEEHREEVAALQGRLQKSLRDQSREGANLEYLKNIFYRFLTWTDLLGRQQTLTAILTILRFSPEERQAVLRHVAGSRSWWLSGKR